MGVAVGFAGGTGVPAIRRVDASGNRAVACIIVSYLFFTAERHKSNVVVD